MDPGVLELPLAPFLPRISAVLEQRRTLALSAPPGSGKSTLVPPYLMEAPWMAGRRIIMLEPRRLAAVAIASRIAELLGEQAGGRAGYRVRSASRVSRQTRVEVVTEALLTRMIQQDPLLDGVGLVIIDEFHERSIHADLALALALEVRRARPDLALLVMSATLDLESVARILEPERAPEDAGLPCPGQSFPVETLYQPLPVAARWEEAFADALARLFGETAGDILAFLPGAAEIRRTGSRLGGLLAGRAEVLPLHGMLPLEEQRRIAARADSHPQDSASRRIILSTSIAETSLTVPGIRTVADSGWARLSRFHPGTGLDRLVTERVSRSSADQRRGRAARLGPGLCVRFWAESEALLPREDPEILRSDLSGLVLECALWGARAPGDLQWIDPPPAAAWNQAWEILTMLGLVRSDGPTELGRRVAELGLPPRLGVLVARGAARGTPALAAACAAVLEDRDNSGLSGDPDLRLRLELLRSRAGGSPSWRRSVTAEMERILRRIGSVAEAAGTGTVGTVGALGGTPAGPSPVWTAAEEERVGDLLAYAFPDRIARREPDRSYRLVTGRVARFPSDRSARGGAAPVASRAAAAWICAPDADAGETTGLIRLAAPVDGTEAQRVLEQAAEEKLEIRWEGLVPRGYLVRRAGRLSLSEKPVRPPPEEISAAFRDHLQRGGLGVLPWNERSRSFLERLRFYAKARPDAALGDLRDDALVRRAGAWLEPFLSLSGGQVINAEKLFAALRGLLEAAGPAARHFDSEVPQAVTLPTGGSRKIDYASDPPAVEARIQEVFGLAESPRICGVALTFRLLSPARRPLQVTNDLAGFWRGSYAEVRKEMRGRYPKHFWPEDPAHAAPTSGVKRPRT